MNYANIPDELLDLVIGETYESEYTLRQEFDMCGEDLIHAEYMIEEYNNIKNIHSLFAWSDEHVFILSQGPFNDQYLIKVKRNP